MVYLRPPPTLISSFLVISIVIDSDRGIVYERLKNTHHGLNFHHKLIFLKSL